MASDHDTPETILARIDEATAFLNDRGFAGPRIAVVLGSGLGAFGDSVGGDAIPYREIPNFPRPKVAGHAGRLVRGEIAGTPVLVFQGRVHYYEGHPMHQVVLPVRVARRLGVEIVVLTNASGGVREDLAPGTFVCVDDHINLSGHDPLHGPNIEALGTRFPDMSHAYDPKLRGAADEVAATHEVRLAHGVYVMTRGPMYETPAEVRMIRTLGGDMVGMSTVPECIALNHAGARVLAISCVTNRAAGVGDGTINHSEVGEVARTVEGEMVRLLTALVSHLGGEGA